jgi:hypothetical protein
VVSIDVIYSVGGSMNNIKTLNTRELRRVGGGVGDSIIAMWNNIPSIFQAMAGISLLVLAGKTISERY